MSEPSGRDDSYIVLVAPAGLLAGVRDHLHDWSAVGLTRPFCWVGDPAATGPLRGIDIRDGRSAEIEVAEVLATRRYARVRLCVLVPAFRDTAAIDAVTEAQLLDLVRETSGATHVDPIRCVISRPGQGPGRAAVARVGWHNVVLSPEDSRGPTAGRRPLEGTSEPYVVGAHAAAGLSGLVGLWAGVAEGPLDQVSRPPGEAVRVVRTYFRRLDAESVSQTVRDGVLSMSSGLPRPRVANGRAEVVDDVALATSTMADQLWTKHVDVLLGPRAEIPRIDAKPITARAAIKMLFGFLGAMIRNAPMAWWRGMVRRVSSDVARGVHQAVYGQGQSAYEVVVRGVRGDGSPADWTDLAVASAKLSEIVGQPGDRSTHAAQVDLSRVWHDFVSAAFTLADAGERSPQLPPIVVGVDRGVLPTATDSAPPASLDFVAIPSTLHDAVGTDRVRVTDVLGLKTFRARLERAREESILALDADRTRQAVSVWASEHQQSFTVQSARRLGKAVLDRAAEVKGLLDVLATASEVAEPSVEFQRQQRRLAMIMRVLAIVFVVVVAVAMILGGAKVIAWSTAAIVGGVALVVWLVASFVTFLRSQRDLFAELHRRQVAASQAEVSRTNLGYALQDLRRVTAAYAQHLSWSRVVAVMLSQPYGTEQRVLGGDTLSERGLPLGMRLGIADPDEETVGTAVARLRRRIFIAGWLTAPWDTVLQGIARRIGPDAIDLAEEPERIFGERGRAGSLLDRWVGIFEREGPGTAAADALWTRNMTAIGGTTEAESLRARVRVADGAVDRFAFLDGISETTAGDSTSFASELFSGPARARELNKVETSWHRTARLGLGELAVSVQLSAALPPWELVGLEDEPNEGNGLGGGGGSPSGDDEGGGPF